MLEEIESKRRRGERKREGEKEGGRKEGRGGRQREKERERWVEEGGGEREGARAEERNAFFPKWPWNYRELDLEAISGLIHLCNGHVAGYVYHRKQKGGMQEM